MQGVDLFCGAGGMSIGAELCGIKVKYAVENDIHAASTFALNHKDVKLLKQDIRSVSSKDFNSLNRREQIIVFGGPPCQGFSTSNQTTRSRKNENNWLYLEYVRLVSEIMPDWVVFENVKGLVETEKGFFLDSVLTDFEKLGYTTSCFILNSAEFGVPQKRNRLFIIGNLHGVKIDKPKATVRKHITVRQAIEDLPEVENGNPVDALPYHSKANSTYAKKMRKGGKICTNNIVTNNAKHILTRYKYIPQGGNWENIPKRLMKNYTDVTRCHTGIYHRLSEHEPSVVIGNFRKNMLIHPWKDRGLSIREAARLQSIPDRIKFLGSIGFQQQQVGNLVPPLLAKAVFDSLLKFS